MVADETLDYIGEAARRAAELSRNRPDRVVFSVGSELTLFMRGIVEGDSLFERMGVSYCLRVVDERFPRSGGALLRSDFSGGYLSGIPPFL